MRSDELLVWLSAKIKAFAIVWPTAFEENFMKSTKPDPPLRGAPSETPNVTKLSPERQLLKDAVDTLGDIISGAASGATEILVPLVASPTIKPPPQADPTNPVCLCTT